MKIAGPKGPITVDRDALGYPIIHARDEDDAAWARGWFHGHDRLAQVHLTLAAARGELLAIVGEKKFARAVDRAARGLGLTRDLDRQEAELTPATRRWVQTYSDGFNAGAKVRGTPLLLRLLGRRVETFTPKSLLAIYRIVSFFGLTSMQQTAELIIAELVAKKMPREAFDALLGDGAKGLDLDALAGLEVPEEYALLSGSAAFGSNAFAISGKVSRSGGALLMGEFHMEVGRFPPTLYASHTELEDGRMYQGVGVPGFAWLSSGRNDHVAWSYTFGHADNVDLVAEQCDGGRTFRRRDETVHVRGKRKPETWTFWDGEYGTVLGDATKHDVLPCMRWSGLDAVAADVEAAHASLEAKTTEDMIGIIQRFQVISLQGVVADTNGDVAEAHCGRCDVRPEGWSGAYPFPAWKLPTRTPEAAVDSRPLPTRGAARVLAANHRPRGERAKQWITLPEPHARYERLAEKLETVDDLEGMVRLSYDAFDKCAERLVAIWAPHLPDDPEARALVTWAKEQRDRSLLGLFHALHAEVSRVVLEKWLGVTRTARILDELGALFYFQFHLDEVLALQRPDLLDDKGLHAVLARAWRIAKTGRARAELPIKRRFVDAVTAGKAGRALGMCSDEVTFPGAPCAPFQTRAVRFEEESLVFGPAFHYVTDLSERGGFYHLPGGASESRRGPGYGKGLDLWTDGRFLPLGKPKSRPPNLRGKTRA